jgi:transmembrane protein 231
MQVYAEPLCRRHYASWVGEATVFRVGLFLISVVISLVVAYATGGFWLKVKPTLAQPTVHYTQDALLLFEVGGRGCY